MISARSRERSAGSPGPVRRAQPRSRCSRDFHHGLTWSDWLHCLRWALPSFAKTNWILKILGLREDGFHELRTVLQTLDLADRLILRVTADPAIRIQVHGRSVPAGPGNLVCRAARLLQRVAGVSCGVELTLTKRIPVGAGLGGGSGNAAVTLMGLNQLWSCGLGLSDLTGLAAELGSDVPFFLHGGTALGKGRGEIISPLCRTSGAPWRSSFSIRGRGLSTRTAYSMGNWGVWEGGDRLTRSRTQTTIHRFSGFRDSLLWAHLENDFETLLFQRYGFLEEARKALIALGCERVMVCGSGSTLMGLRAPGPAPVGRRAVRPSERRRIPGLLHSFRKTLQGTAERVGARRSGLTFPVRPAELPGAPRRETDSMSSLKIFTGSANAPLTEEICHHLGEPLGQGESDPVQRRRGSISRFLENVRGQDVFVVQPTCPPVGENLMELLIMLGCLSAFLGTAGHGRGSLLRLRASGPEGQAESPHLGQTGGGSPDRGRHPSTPFHGPARGDRSRGSSTSRWTISSPLRSSSPI